MQTKTEQLEICRTCTEPTCADCNDNKYVKKIKESLLSVHNLHLPADCASYFGKAPCDTCKDSLAGDRYKICGVGNCDRETIEFVVCTDCFGYLFT